jgi:cholesterol oxidase
MVIGYGMTPDRGRFAYDAAAGRAVLRFPFLGDQHSYRVIDRRMHEIVGANGTLLDTNAALPNTWHGLGGVVMGRTCDLEGRVLGQRGLYVLDGALIPGSTGACNPSMTIAAVAERAMDVIVRDDVGTVI